jgi:hypothetical protein
MASVSHLGARWEFPAWYGSKMGIPSLVWEQDGNSHLGMVPRSEFRYWYHTKMGIHIVVRYHLGIPSLTCLPHGLGLGVLSIQRLLQFHVVELLLKSIDPTSLDGLRELSVASLVEA